LVSDCRSDGCASDLDAANEVSFTGLKTWQIVSFRARENVKVRLAKICSIVASGLPGLIRPSPICREVLGNRHAH